MKDVMWKFEQLNDVMMAVVLDLSLNEDKLVLCFFCLNYSNQISINLTSFNIISVDNVIIVMYLCIVTMIYIVYHLLYSNHYSSIRTLCYNQQLFIPA